MEEKFLRAKKRLLGGGYGRYDFIAGAVLSREELLSEKPRQLLELLSQRMEMGTVDINRNTFYSFLHRYRKQDPGLPAPVISAAPAENKFSSPGNTDKSWLDFVPSKPVLRRETIGDILKPVRYDDEL